MVRKGGIPSGYEGQSKEESGRGRGVHNVRSRNARSRRFDCQRSMSESDAVRLGAIGAARECERAGQKGMET